VAPGGSDTRPTTDRVRESIFNALGSIEAMTGARAIDLFAGSGAMGIEALSRGASTVTFVERDPVALDALRANLEATGVASHDPGVARVVAGDALDWCRSHASGDPSGWWDVALCDPPYEFDEWGSLLDIVPAVFVVIESNRGVVPPAGWELVREKTYGSTVVTFVRRQEPAP